MKGYEYLSEIPAKPTTYKGVNFKSKLEAQWAEFFDALDLSWQYEKDKILLPDGTYYVSDFTLHNEYNYAIYEMKPKGVVSEKFIAAEKVINKDIDAILFYTKDTSRYTETVLMQGSIYDHYMSDFCDLNFCYRCGVLSSYEDHGIGSEYAWWGVQCLRCDWDTPSGGGNSPEYSSVTKLHYIPHKGNIYISEEDRHILIKKFAKAAERIIWPEYYK